MHFKLLVVFVEDEKTDDVLKAALAAALFPAVWALIRR